MNKLRRQKHITPLRLQCCLTWRNPAASGLRKLKPSTQGACDTHGLGAHGVRSTTSQTLRGLKPQHKHCCCNPRRRRGPDSTPTVTRLVCTDVSNARSSCVHETENFSGRLRRRTKKQPHSHLASLPGATRGARTVRSLLRVSLRAARGPDAVTAHALPSRAQTRSGPGKAAVGSPRSRGADQLLRLQDGRELLRRKAARAQRRLKTAT